MKMNKDKRYLFICAYGQNRSLKFAEHFMRNGYMCKWAGHLEYATPKVQDYDFEWADVIVLLDKYSLEELNKEFHMTINDGDNKELVKFYIEDDNSMFEKEIKEFEKYMENRKNE